MTSITWSQSLVSRKSFLHEVVTLASRKLFGEPIDAVSRIQEEVGFSLTSAKQVLDLVDAYEAQADRVDLALRRSILTRRIQLAGDFKVTYSPELDMVNWANLDLNLFLMERLEGLRETIGEEEYGTLAQFIEDRFPERPFFPLRPGESGPAALPIQIGWKQSPAGFWRDEVKSPLSGLEGEQLFLLRFKDRLLPPADVVPYLEGIVVSVTSGASGEQRVLLSMDDDNTPDVALRVDGVDWKLRSEPEVGTVVRFSGVAREFSPEPFLIELIPDRITGLSMISSALNPPFTTLGLAR